MPTMAIKIAAALQPAPVASPPEKLKNFASHGAPSVTTDYAKPGIPILPLTGEHFTHPGPELLKGLEELRQTMAAFGA